MDEYSLSDLALVSGKSNDGFGGSSAWVLIILFALIFGWGGNGFGNNAGQATAASTADIQRAVDLNSIQEGQAGIASDIQRCIYERNGATKDFAYNNLSEIRDVQASIATGNANIINNLTSLQANMQNCCCTTQRAIDGVNYNASINTANLTSAIHAEGEATRALIQQNKIEALQAKVNALETASAINSATAGVVKYPMATTYAVASPCFNSGCGCGNI